ncbi:MAG: hypothetical protein MZV70_15995, partial [Desulfobacterales bacterium]|nr:hypothetical protein [Desulfobacterales bacterium]
CPYFVQLRIAKVNLVTGTQDSSTFPHSVYQLLTHMTYWQDWVAAWLDGERTAVPRHASSWPAESGPTSRREWDDAVARFVEGFGASIMPVAVRASIRQGPDEPARNAPHDRRAQQLSCRPGRVPAAAPPGGHRHSGG